LSVSSTIAFSLTYTKELHVEVVRVAELQVLAPRRARDGSHPECWIICNLEAQDVSGLPCLKEPILRRSDQELSNQGIKPSNGQTGTVEVAPMPAIVELGGIGLRVESRELVPPRPHWGRNERPVPRGIVTQNWDWA